MKVNVASECLIKIINMLLLAFILGTIYSQIFGWDAKCSDRDLEVWGRQRVEAGVEHGGVCIIDVRAKEFYDLGHVPGAINIPIQDIELAEYVWKENLSNKVVVVYCSGKECQDSRIAARKFSLICKEVKIYEGGWDDWNQN